LQIRAETRTVAADSNSSCRSKATFAALVTAIRLTSLVLVLSLGCAPSRVDPEAYRSAHTIVAACSGGIMGFVNSVQVHRDGRIEYVRDPPVSRRGPEAVAKSRVDDWIAALEAAKFLDRTSHRRERIPDGVDCGITLEGPGLAHSLETHPDLTPEIRRVFEEVIGLAPQ
jgi:hypothetical protein